MQLEAMVEAMPAHRLPTPFRDLAWQTFFASRSRGISLDVHFPWLSDPGEPALAVIARAGTAAAALLVMREGKMTIGGEPCTIAAIGLVCTDPAWRGRGLASTLVERAMTEAVPRVDMALLWTRQAAFYERLGFRTADPMVTGVAGISTPLPSRDPREGRFADSPLGRSTIFSGLRGIPPFVKRVRVFEAPSVAVAIGETAPGDLPVLLGWEGDPDLVLDIVAGLGSPTIRWNGADGDCLSVAATRRGYVLDLQPTELAMWRPLSARAPALATLATTPIPILDRF